MNNKLLVIGLILFAGIISGCATTSTDHAATGGGLLGSAESYGLVGESNAKKARKVAEFLVGKGEGNPVKGWDYDSGIEFIGAKPVEPGGAIRPADLEAWATYSRKWKPFDAILIAPAGSVPATSGGVIPNTPAAPSGVMWTNTSELANALEAMFDAVDKEGAK